MCGFVRAHSFNYMLTLCVMVVCNTVSVALYRCDQTSAISLYTDVLATQQRLPKGYLFYTFQLCNMSFISISGCTTYIHTHIHICVSICMRLVYHRFSGHLSVICRGNQWFTAVTLFNCSLLCFAGKSLCCHENHCDTQLWARAAHWLQCLGRLSLPPSEGR